MKRTLVLVAYLLLAALLPRPSPAQGDTITLKGMIGQMILLGFDGTGPEDRRTRSVIGLVESGGIGGVILFPDNIKSPEQVRRLNDALAHARADHPPLIAIDQEGGRVQRLTEAKDFRGTPAARTVATLGVDAAHQLYSQAAVQLASLGINVNFGPVVDLNIAPNSPAIGRLGRSYGSRPSAVTAFAYQFIRAHREAGILTSLKHFPGHGSATADSHRHTADIAATWSEAELSPFQQLSTHADMIMVGHLLHPRFSDEAGRPASLSKRTIQTEIRERLGFDGLIVVDDLNMSAISDEFSLERAAVLAVAAGADLLIVGQQLKVEPRASERIISAVSEAVEAGHIDRSSIEASYGRIQAAKAKLKP